MKALNKVKEWTFSALAGIAILTLWIGAQYITSWWEVAKFNFFGLLG